MFNIISINKAPNFKYTDEMSRFLMNTLAFSVGLVTKDYSTFDPEVLKIMEEEPDWLQESVVWCQSLIVGSLVDSGNYDGTDEIMNEFNCLLNLYDRKRQRELIPSEDDLFLNIHDKFLALLLTDDELITNLLEVE
ncbi:DUF3206 domain-containing protein [Enterococcus faecium]|jgi:hypothetical protein|uniref:DUF3206 domain-containing protein n=1 Tax=Enterococcus TaxID=1350 RepID=UPI000EE291FF|nr:DUF3206 domain-containing protein [Enterococcus faecium]MCI1904507.1 DUF3206 domain-containing protein [Enterococcaceae bacterium]HCB28632.1 DUF3206 domain-containing protein [Enterococcus sp.]KAA9199174.1 DUF3206 domain-containing protein [Enterococcus faecium]KAA9199379.1 DUF3206 domain-containing protein [Enterococcus faecium]MCC9080114.1 DUF3206 domain-containing protein [Enterococcus faecium]